MKRLNGIDFRQGVETAAAKISSDLNMTCTIIWKSGMQTAAIDNGGRVYLANVPDDMIVTQALVEKYTGFVVHELLHRKYTNFYAGTGAGQYLSALHNAIEDAWIERRAIREGLTGNVQGLLTGLVNQMVREAMDQVQDWAAPEQYPFALAVYGRGFCNRVPLAQGLEPIFKEAESRIDACNDSLGTFAVAKWVHDQIKGLPEKDKAEEKKKSGTGKSAEKGAGEGAEKDAGEGAEGSAEKDAGKGAGKKEGKASKPGEKCKPRQVEPTLDKMDSGYSGTYSRVLVQREGKHTSPYVKRDVTINVPARMRFEVKKLFENTATDEFQINRKAGSLNVRALHKAHTSDAVFKRRLEADGIDSAVVIMLDVSGSMFYEQRVRDDNGNVILDPDTGIPKKDDYIRHALKTCAALVDTLNRAQVKVSIVTFGTDVSVLKPFDMSARRGLEELARVKEGGQTNDCAALRYCHELLNARREARRVVFVITDGEGDCEMTRAQVDAGANLKITTVGIGIDIDVSGTYPQSVQVSGRDVGAASFKQIRLAA